MGDAAGPIQGRVRPGEGRAVTLPNFLLLGAMKAGTTAVFYGLRQHPEIYVSSVKEPHFFSYLGVERPPRAHHVTRLEDYERLFDDAGDALAIGECSPSYISHPRAAERIRSIVPDARLVAILRDPADRAFSHYQHRLQIGREHHPDFLKAIDDYEATGAETGMAWSTYLECGFYGRHLRRFLALFDAGQLHWILYDDFRKQPLEVLSDLFRFLGVDPTFESKMQWYWRSGQPRSRRLFDLINQPPPALSKVVRRMLPQELRIRVQVAVHNRNLVRAEPMSREQRQHLIAIYRDDILELQDLLHRDLSVWLAA
jgi:Sulfotransferase domain